MDLFLDRARPEAVSELRRQIGAFLERHATDADAAHAGQLVVGELLANALEHSTGDVWVSVDWTDERPVVTVHDLGSAFAVRSRLPAMGAEGGRGLYLVTSLAGELRQAAKAAGGKAVRVRLDVRRRREASFDPPRQTAIALPELDEALPDGGFGKQTFLRALVVQLAQAIEEQQGPDVAEAAVAQVGADVGGRMEEEYRAARMIVARLTPEQIADCYVRLKRAIDGDFYLIDVTDRQIVLGNRRCPFGAVVRRAPALCRMTSSVFGGIAARNTGGASVVLEERIAVGDPECRVVVHLGGADGPGHRYAAPSQTG